MELLQYIAKYIDPKRQMMNNYFGDEYNVPDQTGAVLLLIDVISDLEFESGDQLLKLALPAGKSIAELKKRAKAIGIPAIYVNDNFGKWRSDFKKIVAHCIADGVRGKPFCRVATPGG